MYFSVFKMGSASDLLIRMESESKPAAKKFSPFSVDSLLATKVKEQQDENQNDAKNAVDLSLKIVPKTEEEEEEFEEEIEDEDLEECDEDLEKSTTTILSPHARFPLGLPLHLPPVPTSAWNPVNPWMPQFRSPLNPFMPRKL